MSWNIDFWKKTNQPMKLFNVQIPFLNIKINTLVIYLS